MLKEILFTHNDLDGAGCRIMYELYRIHVSNTTYAVTNCTNANVDDMVRKALEDEKIGLDTFVTFADISPSQELLEELLHKVHSVEIYDHHITAQFATELLGEDKGVVKVENELGELQCGTSLLYQNYVELAYMTPGTCTFKDEGDIEALGEFVDIIRSYDTWEWKKTNNMKAKYMNILFFMLGMDRFCNKFVKRLKHKSDEDLISDNDLEFIMARIEAEQRVIERITLDVVYTINLRGYKTAFMCATGAANISELSNQFLLKYPDYDIFVSYYFQVDGGGGFSFRTVRDDIDLANDFAKPLGGGGHVKAAGASASPELVDELIQTLIKHLNV